MVKLYDKETNEFLGRISDEQWKYISDQLEDESIADHDYYIRKETLEAFEESGVDSNVVALLRTAMKPRDAIEVRWDKE